MRVPIRSAGTRSGVNWIRLNWPPIDAARVLIAIVLASPGTPSTRRCPRASSATASRSSSTSCPTMIFLNSSRTLSIGDVDGHREADADEDIVLGGVDERGDDADDPAVPIEQRSARVARVDGRVDLDEVGED